MTAEKILGDPCRICTSTLRYVSTGKCVACLLRREKVKDKKKVRAYQKQWRAVRKKLGICYHCGNRLRKVA